MFKKLKDKIAEEVRQAPLRLPASVQQQLSQYSFTRDSSTDSINTEAQISGLKDFNGTSKTAQLVDIAEDTAESAAAGNQFSIGENDSRPTSPFNRDEQFQAVNLNEPKRDNVTSTPQPSQHNSQPGGRLSRQSSLSSLFGDISFLPGLGDSTYHPYQFQSDLESNVSEFDDSASNSGQQQYASDRVSKEHIFNAYQKMRTRYHKYKGRYADLARHYKELEREREKVKHVLADTQDRSLRRISELKEQCVLEQQAKAHLEENLRSDLEERDNMIAVLQTKVKLLSSGGTSTEGSLIDLSNSDGGISSRHSEQTDGENGSPGQETEVQQLKDKLQRFEGLLMKCKENIKNQKDRIGQLLAENEAAKASEAAKSGQLEQLQSEHSCQLAQLTESLNMARLEIQVLRKQEQEAAIAAAETKQVVHVELLKSEEEMVRLRSERDHLINKVAMMEKDIQHLKEEAAKQLQEAEMVLELEKQKLLKELSRGKTEALKLMDEDMDQRLEEVKREKDAHWEGLLQKRLSDEMESHARALRSAEEQYRSRLAELQEEKALALEEKELHCTSLLAREQSNQQGLKDEVASLKQEVDAQTKMVEKAQGELLDERRSWVQQIESNRQRHLEEIQTITAQHRQLVEEQERRHGNVIDAALLELKEQHRLAIENIQQQHEELLQAANEDMESSAKTQIEQLRSLLRDKESELAQQSEVITQIRELSASRESTVSVLESQIGVLQKQLESLDSVSQKLASLTSELEKAKEDSVRLQLQVDHLEKEAIDLRETVRVDKQQIAALEEQLERQYSDFQAEKQEQHESRIVVESQLASVQEASAAKDARITELDREAQSAASTLQEATAKLSAATTELAELKSALAVRDERILQLEQVQSTLSAGESELKAMTEERERQLADKQSEVETMQQSLHAHERRIVELTSEVETLKRQCAEQSDRLDASKNELLVIQATVAEREGNLAEANEIRHRLETERTELKTAIEEHQQQLASKQSIVEAFQKRVKSLQKETKQSTSELRNLRESLAAKEERILQLEQAEAHRNASESELKAAIEGGERTLNEKQAELSQLAGELETARQSLQRNENSMAALQQEVDLCNRLLAEKEAEWEQKAVDLAKELDVVRSECSSTTASQHDRIRELELSQSLASSSESQLKVLAEELRGQLSAKVSEFEALQERVRLKDQHVADAQVEAERSRQQLVELQQDTLNLSSDLDAARSELESLKIAQVSKDGRIQELENASTNWSASECRLRSMLEESERLASSKQSELEAVQQSYRLQEQQASAVQQEIEQLQRNEAEWQQKVESSARLLEELQSAQLVKDARILELEQANASANTREFDLGAATAEMQRQLTEKESQIERARQLYDTSSDEWRAKFEELSGRLVAANADYDARIAQLEHEKLAAIEQGSAAIAEKEAEWSGLRQTLSDQLADRSESIRQLQGKMDDLERVQRSFKEEEDRLQMESENLIRSLADKENAILDLQRKLDEVNEILNESANDATTKRAELTALKQLLSEKESDEEQRRISNESELHRISLLEEELRSHQMTSEQSAHELKALSDQVATLTEEKGRLESLCKRLKVQLTDTKKMLSASKRVQAETVQDPEIKSHHTEEQLQQKGQDEMLQQQLVIVQKELDTSRHQHKMEVAELKRLLEMSRAPVSSNGANNVHASLEEATELEYLRNILFEYMMGRQNATLAKVVAAVVKFTPEQTRRIVEKEEQRQSLLGQLGFA